MIHRHVVLTFMFILLLPGATPTAFAAGPESLEHCWDLNQIFASDADWEAERQRFEARLEEVGKVLEGWTATPKSMLEYLELDCELEQSFFRLIYYADLQLAVNQGSPEFSRMRGVMFGLLGQWQSITSPVDSDIIALGQERFETYLQSEPGLAAHAYRVSDRLREDANKLSPEADRLVALSRPLTYHPKTIRDTLYYRNRQSSEKTPFDFSDTFAALMNSEIQCQHIFAQAHGYESSLERRFRSENLDPAIFHRAVELARAHLPLFHRYLSLKKDLIDVEPLGLDELFGPIDAAMEKSYTYDEAEAAVRKSLVILGDEYGEGVRQAFSNRWIDVYPSANKRDFGGVTQVYGLHPYILLNFTGSYRDVNVLTHELGHAIQFWLIDRHHPCVNSATSSFLFEVAAHFNEHLLVDHLLALEKDPAVRIFLLTRHLESMAAAIFGQARISEFEHRMHRRVEEGGTLTAPWLDEQYLELSREYYGHDQGLVQVAPSRGAGWIDIDYLYKSYYAINYTTGMVASLAFMDQIERAGADGVEAYLEFLRSGGTDDPLVLLNRAGVDMNDPETYRAAFRQFERLVAELEETAGH